MATKKKTPAVKSADKKPAPRVLTEAEAAAYRRIYMANRDKVSGHIIELRHGLGRPAYWVGFKIAYKGSLYAFTSNNPFTALPTPEDIGMAIKFLRNELDTKDLVFSIPYTMTGLPKEKLEDMDIATLKVATDYRSHCKAVLLYSNFLKSHTIIPMYQHVGMGFLAGCMTEIGCNYELSGDKKSLRTDLLMTVVTDTKCPSEQNLFFKGFRGADAVVVEKYFGGQLTETTSMHSAAVSFVSSEMHNRSVQMNKFANALMVLEKKGAK